MTLKEIENAVSSICNSLERIANSLEEKNNHTGMAKGYYEHSKKRPDTKAKEVSKFKIGDYVLSGEYEDLQPQYYRLSGVITDINTARKEAIVQMSNYKDATLSFKLKHLNHSDPCRDPQ
jgi:hypothetical protein